MKIVFLGTGHFAVPSLQALHDAGHRVCLVVSQPDRPQGRGLALKPPPVKVRAESLGLPIFQPEKLRLESDRVIAGEAEILVVVAYGQILRENLLNCAPHGAVNVHASLLPRYRGAAPIQWALAHGETETGVTTMRLDRGMDTGPILLQQACLVDPGDTTATLEPKLAVMGAALLLKTLDGLENGALVARPQDEAAATRAPLIRKADGTVDFSTSAQEITNRLRGFSPWPGLQFVHAGRSIRILSAFPLSGGGAAPSEPGRVVRVSKEGLDLACGDGSVLRIEEVQPESRGRMAAFDFANGSKLRAGTALKT